MNLDARIEIRLPPVIRSGSGQASLVSEYLSTRRHGERAFVITDAVNAGRLAKLGLKDAPFFDGVRGEPETGDLVATLEAARRAKPDVIVGLGGGSVMDLAKIVAVLVRTDLTLQDIIGAGSAPARQVGLIQIPTTSGTGSEAGTRALITDPATRSKIAAESPHMLADLVILDPELTVSLPPEITAAVGIDALAHCVEAYTSKRAHPIIDAYALEGIRLVGTHLEQAVRQPDDIEARAGMLLAAFYGGICLGPVNTTAGHAVAYPLGTRYGIAHGLANALVFPYVLAFNSAVAMAKTEIICDALGVAYGDERSIASGAAAFCERIGISERLADFGISKADLPSLAKEAHAIRRLLDNNPRQISVEQIIDIYSSAY